MGGSYPAPPRARGSGPVRAPRARRAKRSTWARASSRSIVRPAVDGVDEQAPDDGVDRGRVGIGITVGEVAGGGSGGERRSQRGAQFGDRLVAGRVEHPGHRRRDEHPRRLAVARVVAEGEDLVDPCPHARQWRTGEIDVIGEASCGRRGVVGEHRHQEFVLRVEVPVERPRAEPGLAEDLGDAGVGVPVAAQHDPAGAVEPLAFVGVLGVAIGPRFVRFHCCQVGMPAHHRITPCG